MIKRVKSFGCSFIFGNDLHDDGRDGPWATPSQHTWPALIAKELDLTYICKAKGGAGNLHILSRILQNVAISEGESIFVINWSWADRFDYTIDNPEHTLDPWISIRPTSNTDQANYYYRKFHSEFRDKLASLTCMTTAITAMQSKNIPFVMTCIDDLIFNRQYHNPTEVSTLQDLVEPYITRFEGKNFLDWSREKGFPISETLHPLEAAHEAAAEYLLPQAQSLIIDTIQRRV